MYIFFLVEALLIMNVYLTLFLYRKEYVSL